MNWEAFYGNLDESNLCAIALLRVIECTNGCIQHAFRAKSPAALSVEETRTAMQFSMAAMKNLSFRVGDQEFAFEGEVAEGLRRARDLYVQAFKQGNEAAMDEFFECSEACVQALGKERLYSAAATVTAYLTDVYPARAVGWGLDYLLRLLGKEE